MLKRNLKLMKFYSGPTIRFAVRPYQKSIRTMQSISIDVNNSLETPIPSKRPAKQKKAVKKRKSVNLRPIVVCLIGILLLVILLIWYIFQSLKPVSPSAPTASQQSAQASGTANSGPRTDIDPDAWNLMLVNSTHPIDETYAPTTKSINGEEEVDERIYDATMEMLQAAEDEGYSLLVCSAYRPYDLQVRLFNEQIDSVMSTQDVSEEEAREIAGTVVAVPGTSEHQTGLSMDIVTMDHQTLDEEVLQTPEIQWLYNNCHKFGFIVRYPQNKMNETGIIYEPWHYRYVGIEAATEIMTRGITLEEYLAEAGVE